MFYDNLKAICDKKGLKITTVVTECGGALGSISKWKNGANPNSDIVIKLSLHLGVTTDYLLMGNEANSSLIELLGVERTLLNDFRSLSEQGQDYIRQQMFMAKEVYKKPALFETDMKTA